MIVLHVTVHVKSEHASEYVELARHDAEHSVKDEPGCLRFDVIQDRDDPNRFYLYEVYRDEAAFEAHKQMPHFKVYAEKSRPLMAAPSEVKFGKSVVPAEADWR